MLRLFAERHSQKPISILMLDNAPGKALRETLKAWKELPNIQVAVNTFNLPSEDKKWLIEQQDLKSCSAISFDPSNTSELSRHIMEVSGYSIITTRLNVSFRAPLINLLTSLQLEQPLKIVGQAGSTVSHVDLIAATRQGVAVTYTPGANANAVAEFVLAQIFNSTRNIITYDKLTQSNVWSKYSFSPRSELRERTLGLIGYGHIGRAVGAKAQALGMPVMVYSRTMPKVIDNTLTITTDINTLLSKADIISIHIPFTPSNRHFIGANELAKMKNGSILINTSRGGIVDEEALAIELKKIDSKIASVAFDVFENEGEKFQSPLVGCSRAILTPHVAGTTETALTTSAVKLIENIGSILLGGELVLANPEVLTEVKYYRSITT